MYVRYPWNVRYQVPWGELQIFTFCSPGLATVFRQNGAQYEFLMQKLWDLEQVEIEGYRS